MKYSIRRQAVSSSKRVDLTLQLHAATRQVQLKFLNQVHKSSNCHAPIDVLYGVPFHLQFLHLTCPEAEALQKAQLYCSVVYTQFTELHRANTLCVAAFSVLKDMNPSDQMMQNSHIPDSMKKTHTSCSRKPLGVTGFFRRPRRVALSSDSSKGPLFLTCLLAAAATAGEC
jgi:hypothetical protein